MNYEDAVNAVINSAGSIYGLLDEADLRLASMSDTEMEQVALSGSCA